MKHFSKSGAYFLFLKTYFWKNFVVVLLSALVEIFSVSGFEFDCGGGCGCCCNGSICKGTEVPVILTPIA